MNRSTTSKYHNFTNTFALVGADAESTVSEEDSQPAGPGWTNWINHWNPYQEGSNGDLELRSSIEPVSYMYLSVAYSSRAFYIRNIHEMCDFVLWGIL